MLFETLMINFMIFIVIVFVVLLSLTLWYYKHIFKPYANFPACRLEYRIPYWSLTGRQLNIAVFQTFVEQSKKYHAEGVFVAWAGQPTLVVYGEDIVKKIVNEPAATDKAKYYRLFEFFIGKGIFTSKRALAECVHGKALEGYLPRGGMPWAKDVLSNGESYIKHRKMLAPAFQVTAVKSYTTILSKNAEAMVNRLYSTEGRPTEDVIDILSECTISNLSDINLGEGHNDLLENKRTIEMLNCGLEMSVRRMFSPWLHFDFSLYLFPSTRKAIRLVTDVIENILTPKLEIIKSSLISRRASLHNDEAEHKFHSKRPKPFGEIFVEQHLQDPTISMKDLALQVSFLVVAGFDTIVHSLNFTFFLLGLHQDVQKRVREEVMAETEGPITYEDQQNLIYLECVIKESLRLYPVPVFGRYIQKDLQCDKYTIPRNSNVLVFSYMLHRNPEIFPNPEKFDPERFLNENSNIKPWQFLPFAEGMRQCPGKNYAMIQMKIILAHVVRNFKIISLDKREDVEVKWSIILESTKNLRMQFVPR